MRLLHLELCQDPEIIIVKVKTRLYGYIENLRYISGSLDKYTVRVCLQCSFVVLTSGDLSITSRRGVCLGR